ncbi:hypothetical protein PG996_004853 [Apiospora saccharicola]|uniref:Ubiquitin-like domain-containing protein n=1 Tax=Apiospora saccharicola TaxID=335842 RepID=A0ABR1W5F5_9PEZI
MFARVPGFWHGVMNGRYDVLGKGGIIMMPQTYDKLIMPGALLTMRMWPPDGLPSSRPTGPMGPPPIGPPPQTRPGSRRTRRAANSGRPVYVGS